jgi:hypothetical protein
VGEHRAFIYTNTEYRRWVLELIDGISHQLHADGSCGDHCRPWDYQYADNLGSPSGSGNWVCCGRSAGFAGRFVGWSCLEAAVMAIVGA